MCVTRRERIRRGKAGYTLVEISVALLVIGLGFVSLLAVFPVGLKWSSETAANSTAPLVAQSVLAQYGNEFVNGWNLNSGTAVLISDYYVKATAIAPTLGDNRLYTVNVYCFLNKRDAGDSGNTVAAFEQYYFK